MTLKDPLDVYVYTEDNSKKKKQNFENQAWQCREPGTVAHGCSLSYLET